MTSQAPITLVELLDQACRTVAGIEQMMESIMNEIGTTHIPEKSNQPIVSTSLLDRAALLCTSLKRIRSIAENTLQALVPSKTTPPEIVGPQQPHSGPLFSGGKHNQ